MKLPAHRSAHQPSAPPTIVPSRGGDGTRVCRPTSQAALLGEAPYRIDHRIVLRDGTVKWVHGQAEITRDGEGRPVQMIGVVLDITERTALEEPFWPFATSPGRPRARQAR